MLLKNCVSLRGTLLLAGIITLSTGLSVQTSHAQKTNARMMNINGAPAVPSIYTGLEADPFKNNDFRGRTHRLHVDNHTYYTIHILLDGEDVGTVKPMGDSYGTYSGVHVLRGVYIRDDGSESYWGPKTVDFDDGDFTWTLTY